MSGWVKNVQRQEVHSPAPAKLGAELSSTYNLWSISMCTWWPTIWRRWRMCCWWWRWLTTPATGRRTTPTSPSTLSSSSSLGQECSSWIKTKLSFSFVYSSMRPRVLLHYLYSSTVWSAASHPTLWGGPGLRFEPGTGGVHWPLDHYLVPTSWVLNF